MGFDINDYIGSGLFEGGRVIIRNPRFTRLPDYRDGQEVLLVADLFLVDEGSEITDQRFGLGNGWVATDDETEITEHRDGKKLKYNDSTAIGHFLKSMPGNMIDALGARWKAGDEVTPFRTGFYDGLEVTIEQHSKDLEINGDKVTQRWFEITEFHGYEGQGTKASGTAKKAAAPAKKASKAVAKKAPSKPAKVEEPTEEPAESGQLDEKVLEAIVRIAWNSEDHDEFVANCYAEIPEVAESEDYQQVVEASGDGSVWATVVAAFEAGETAPE